MVRFSYTATLIPYNLDWNIRLCLAHKCHNPKSSRSTRYRQRPCSSQSKHPSLLTLQMDRPACMQIHTQACARTGFNITVPKSKRRRSLHHKCYRVSKDCSCLVTHNCADSWHLLSCVPSGQMQQTTLIPASEWAHCGGTPAHKPLKRDSTHDRPEQKAFTSKAVLPAQSSQPSCCQKALLQMMAPNANPNCMPARRAH